MNARYYDPHIGVFMRPDPATAGLNHYAYVSCNPIRYTDPTGLYSGKMTRRAHGFSNPGFTGSGDGPGDGGGPGDSPGGGGTTKGGGPGSIPSINVDYSEDGDGSREESLNENKETTNVKDNPYEMNVENLTSNISIMLLEGSLEMAGVTSSSLVGMLINLAINADNVLALDLTIKALKLREAGQSQMLNGMMNTSEEALWNVEVAQWDIARSDFLFAIVGAIKGVTPPQNLKGALEGLKSRTEKLKNFLYGPSNKFYKKGKIYKIDDLQYKEMPENDSLW